MVWDERRPEPLTKDKVEAVFHGRNTVASFVLPGLLIYCWHFAVRNDGDYWIVAVVVSSDTVSKVYRDEASAMDRFNAAVAHATVNVLNDCNHLSAEYRQLLESPR